MHDLEDCVRAQVSMRVDGRAFAINDGQGEVGWVDAAAEQEGVVVVNSFIVQHCRLSATVSQIEETSLPFAPIGPVQLV